MKEEDAQMVVSIVRLTAKAMETWCSTWERYYREKQAREHESG